MNSDHKDQQASLRKPGGSSEGMFLWSYPIYYFLSRVYDSWTGFDLFGKRIFRSSKYFSSPPDKKKKPQKKCSCVKPSTFLSLKVTWEIKISKWKKKSGERKKIWGGILFFYYYFFVNFFLLTFTRKKHKNAMCESDWGKKKKSQNNNKNTFSPRVKLKKISGEKKLFFSVWKKSPDSK